MKARDSRNDELPSVDWERLARTELHHIRIAILDLLRLDGGRTLSATEMAFELRLPLSNVNYHLKALGASGFLVQVEHLRTRGTTEHFVCLEGHDGADLFLRPPFDGSTMPEKRATSKTEYCWATQCR